MEYKFEYKEVAPIHKTLKLLKDKVQDDELRYELLTNLFLEGAYNAKKDLGDKYFFNQFTRHAKEGSYLATSLVRTLQKLSDNTPAEELNSNVKKNLEKLITENTIPENEVYNPNYRSIYIFLRRILKEKPHTAYKEIGFRVERMLLEPWEGHDLSNWYMRQIVNLRLDNPDTESILYQNELDRIHAKCFIEEQNRIYKALKFVLYSEN